MFETHIEKTRQRILSNIDTDSKYLYLQDILNNDSVIPCFKKYFTAEVAWWIYKEQLIREKNKNFDLEQDDIKSFYKKIDDLYMKTARFDKVHIAKITDNAVKTILNFLVRPQTTLKWFIFRGELTKTFYEVLLRLDYLYHYSYLKEGIISAFSNESEELEQKIIISSAEFADIIDNTDEQHVSSLDNDGFIELITPIFEFFNHGRDIDDNSVIPIEAMILYFDDKSLDLLKQKTESMLFDDDIKHISIKDIRHILEMDSQEIANEIAEDDDITVSEQDDDTFDIPDFELPKSEGTNEEEEAIESIEDINEDDIKEEEFSEDNNEDSIEEDSQDTIEPDDSIEEETPEEDFSNEAEQDISDMETISEDDFIETLDIADLEEFTDDDEVIDESEITNDELLEQDDFEKLSEELIQEDSDIQEDDITSDEQIEDEQELQEEEYELEEIDEEELSEIIDENLDDNEEINIEDNSIEDREIEDDSIDDNDLTEESSNTDEDISDEEDIIEDNEMEDEIIDDNESDEEDITDTDTKVDNNEDTEDTISNKYINQVFGSVFESFGDEDIDLIDINNTDKERISDILSKSLDILEEAIHEYKLEEEIDDDEPNDTIPEDNETEEEIDEIELMKQSLGLIDEEEEKPQNLAQAIAKKFVEESAKKPESDPIIPDDIKTDEIKDFINEDFEDDK
jgi:hypothetical protein